jgi:hypothetical protein
MTSPQCSELDVTLLPASAKFRRRLISKLSELETVKKDELAAPMLRKFLEENHVQFPARFPSPPNNPFVAVHKYKAGVEIAQIEARLLLLTKSGHEQDQELINDLFDHCRALYRILKLE